MLGFKIWKSSICVYAGSVRVSFIQKLKNSKYISDFNYLKNVNWNSLINSIIKQVNNETSLLILVSRLWIATNIISFLEFEFSIHDSYY